MIVKKNLIKAMLKVISAKNFSPALTYMYYDSVNNKITGTDSFILLQFYPNTPPLSKDIYINCNELKVIKDIGCKDDIIEMTEKKEMLCISGIESECIFYTDPVSDVNSKYPDTTQESLFGKIPGELQKLPITEGMELYQEIARIIGGNGNNATITDTTLNLIFSDERGRYELVYRRD